MDENYAGPERRRFDERCHDHDTRIRLLESLCDQLSERMDRSESLLHAIEHTVNALDGEMKNHIQVMRQHIDHSFALHERNEMAMHKDMLFRAVQMMGGIVVALVSAVGIMGWWVFEHVVGGL